MPPLGDRVGSQKGDIRSFKEKKGAVKNMGDFF
jgi:hypothetical protein